MDLPGRDPQPDVLAGRRQETLLNAVYRFHPAFADEKFDVWLGDLDAAPVDTQMATLEGGDVMPIGKGIVVIGMGERTSQQAISQVATSLFAGGAAEGTGSSWPACRGTGLRCTSTPCSRSVG